MTENRVTALLEEIHAPSANGKDSGNGKAAEPAGPAGRDKRGRFAAGNAGGPGNPFARQTAALRQALLDAVTAEDMQAVARALIESARQGNVQAAKVLLGYTIGKPAPPPEPDLLDAQEWQGYKETAGMLQDMPKLLVPGPELPLSCVRAARPELSKSIGGSLANLLTTRDSKLPALLDMMKSQPAEALALLKRPPSANDKNGKRPATRKVEAAT